MRTALLRGRDHVELGAVAAEAEGPVAVAISRGGAPKTYGHQEPNEDAALFAIGERGWLLAVADGHYGSSGAEQALEMLARESAPRWLDDPPPAADDAWRTDVLGVFRRIDAAIQTRGRDAGLMAAPTTLTVAVVRPADGRFWHASMGDSHLFEVLDEGDLARDLSSGAMRPGRPGFLGEGFESDEALADRAETGSGRLAGVRALALATDGLSEVGIGVADPTALVLELGREVADGEPEAALRPLALARGLAEAANRAHQRQRSGDNVAAAVIWLSPPR